MARHRRPAAAKLGMAYTTWGCIITPRLSEKRRPVPEIGWRAFAVKTIRRKNDNRRGCSSSKVVLPENEKIQLALGVCRSSTKVVLQEDEKRLELYQGPACLRYIYIYV